MRNSDKIDVKTGQNAKKALMPVKIALTPMFFNSKLLCRELATSGLFGQNSLSTEIAESVCNSVIDAFNDCIPPKYR